MPVGCECGLLLTIALCVSFLRVCIALCAGWTMATRVSPLLLWDDSGSTGRKGSLWQVGSLGLLHASEGHELAADEKFVDMLPMPIIAAHNFVPNPIQNK